jgi:hypothetical protein
MYLIKVFVFLVFVFLVFVFLVFVFLVFVFLVFIFKYYIILNNKNTLFKKIIIIYTKSKRTPINKNDIPFSIVYFIYFKDG